MSATDTLEHRDVHGFPRLRQWICVHTMPKDVVMPSYCVGNRQPPPFLKLSIQQILISNFLFGDRSLKVFDNFQKSIHFKVPVKTLPCIRCVRAHIRRFFGIGLIK